MKLVLPFSSARGFSLIEMAVVILVITILLAIVAVPLTTQVESRRIDETQKKLEVIREALYGFALTRGRLPRPASSATNGNENPNPCTTNATCTGFIPWITLGIDRADAWGNIYRYSVTPEFSAAVPGGANAAFALTATGKNVIRTRDAAGIEVTLADQVPAVLWSHGPQNHGTDALTANARPSPSLTNTDEQRNNTLMVDATPCTLAGICVVSRNPSTNTTQTGGEFDDMVVWLSTNILFSRMVQAGKLP